MQLTILPLRTILNDADSAAQWFCHDCGIFQPKFTADIVRVFKHFILTEIHKQISTGNCMISVDSAEITTPVIALMPKVGDRIRKFIHRLTVILPQWFTSLTPAGVYDVHQIKSEHGELWDSLITSRKKRPSDLQAVKRLMQEQKLTACNKKLHHEYDFVLQFYKCPVLR